MGLWSESAEGLERHSKRLLHDVNPQNIANSVWWACAVVDHWPGHLAHKSVLVWIESGTAIDSLIISCGSLLVLLVTNADEDKILGAFRHMEFVWGQIADHFSTADLSRKMVCIRQVLKQQAVGRLYGNCAGVVIYWELEGVVGYRRICRAASARGMFFCRSWCK